MYLHIYIYIEREREREREKEIQKESIQIVIQSNQIYLLLRLLTTKRVDSKEFIKRFKRFTINKMIRHKI